MQKFNLHVLTLLGALVFCVGLVNLSSDSFQKDSAEADSGLSIIPTLSSSVSYYQQELNLPEAEYGESHSNQYLDIIRNELKIISQEQAEEETAKVELQPETAAVIEAKPEKKPVTTNPVKKEKVAKKKNYVERWALVTAYCPCSKCCGTGTPGRTSIGKSAWKPGIAADPRAIPYGVEVYVKGYGRYKVDDTGGAMRRSWRRKGLLHLDIRMTYHYQAVKWGRKMMKIRVYNK